MRHHVRLFGWLLILALMSPLVHTPAALAQDDGSWSVTTKSTRSSPFDPPSDDAFVADAGTGLDTGCTFNTDPAAPLTISVPVNRYVGPVNANGFLTDAQALIDKGIIPATIDIIMPAFDVDVNGSPPPEQDGVVFNGQRLGILNGDNQIWLLNSFSVDVTQVKFPASPGGTATNTVVIQIDELSTGRWCTSIDWVALVVPIRPEAAFTLTSGGNDIQELPDDVFFEQDVDADCNVSPVKTDFNIYPFSGPSSTDVAVQTDVALCPAGGPNPDVEVDWSVVGTSLNGTETFTGTSSTVNVRTPAEVGTYTVDFTFTVDGRAFPTYSRKLFVTKNTPLGIVGTPKRYWYELATDWASGQSAESNILQSLLDGLYGYGNANWRYGYNFGGAVKCNWQQLTDDPITCDYADCYVFSDVFTAMSAVLGVGGLQVIQVFGANGVGFVTSGAPSLDPAFPGNAKPLGSTTYDRYFFSSHSLRLKGGTYYDATFNGTYGADDAFISFNLNGNSNVDANGFFYETDEGAKLYPRAGNVYDGWGNNDYTLPPTGGNGIRITEAGLLQPSTNDVTTMATDFNFTGDVSFTARDADGNGVAEQYVADVGVELTATATYTVFGQLVKNGEVIANRPLFESMQPTKETLSDDAGTYTVTLPFSGEQIFRSGEDGPYDLRLFAVGESGEFEQATLSTPAVSHTAFGEVAAVVSSATDAPVDTDGNGFFDFVDVSVTLDVRSSGTFQLQGSLSGSGGGETIVSAGQEVDLSSGSQTVTLRFDGQPLRRSGVNGPYDLTVTLYDALGSAISGATFSTAAYDATTFGALLNLDGSFNDTGVDESGNGLFDKLRVTFGAEVFRAGSYLLSGSLTDASGTTIIYADATVPLSEGSQTVTLDFAGSLIREKQIDGPYTVAVVVRDPSTLQTLDRVTLPQSTGAYSYTDFAPAGTSNIQLTGVTSDEGVDTDGNGRFDVLRVEVEVALAQSDFYEWSARLVDANGTELDFDAQEGSLSAGLATITLEFDGEAIGNNNVDGPYAVRGLLMFGRLGSNLVATDVATTQAYDVTQFESTNQAPTANAGPDQELTPPPGSVSATVTLDGSGSIDPNGDALTFTWSEKSNVLAGPTTEPQSNVLLTIGTHRIVLTVTDAFGATDTDTVTVQIGSNLFGMKSGLDVPAEFRLDGNAPNPFSGATTIQFALPESRTVSLAIYDLMGRRLETLIDKTYPAGTHRVVWNAASRPSGVYFYRLRAGEDVATGRMTLTK